MSAAFHRDAVVPSGRARLEPLTLALTSAAAMTDILDRAADPNPFYAPSFLAGSLALKESRPVSALKCFLPDGRLEAFLPIRQATFTETSGMSLLKAYRNPYIMRSEPLLDKSRPVEAATALIQGLVQHAGSNRIFQFPMLDLDGATFLALKEAARLLGREFLILDEHKRAVLHAGDVLEKVRAKEALRQLRRLQAKGHVELKISISGPEAAPVFEDFLKVEASGWKGTEGTALTCRPETLAFAKAALHPAVASTLCDAIYLDGRPIAADVSLLAGGRLMTLKCGYDEEFRQFSPGVVLDYLLCEHALQSGAISTIDGCSVPGHVIEKLWPSRMRIGNVVLDISPNPSPRFFAMRINVLAHLLGARDVVRTLLRRWNKT
jgi:CelD/BcsL family acetyltransferase involved in cellulose biosynthesis